MRGLGIVTAALFGVALLAYAVGLGIYAVASTQPVISTEPRTDEEARYILEHLNLSEDYPLQHRFLLTPHGRMHFVDEGRGEKETLLCLHSNGGWSLECAPLFEKRSEGSRIVAPDLVGFGLSEKPEVLPADVVASHAADLAVLIEILDLRAVWILASPSTQPVARALARLEPERVTGTQIRSDGPPEPRVSESFARVPLLGEVWIQGLGGMSPGFARSPMGRLQGSWDERASALALARAEPR